MQHNINGKRYFSWSQILPFSKWIYLFNNNNTLHFLMYEYSSFERYKWMYQWNGKYKLFYQWIIWCVGSLLKFRIDIAWNYLNCPFYCFQRLDSDTLFYFWRESSLCKTLACHIFTRGPMMFRPIDTLNRYDEVRVKLM